MSKPPVLGLVARCGAATVAALLLLSSSCTPAARRAPSPGPALAVLSPSDELFNLSPARVQMRRLGPQSMRLLVPHWSSVRESDRRVLQATLVSTLSEDRMAPFVHASLKKSAEADPALAAKALEWLRSPLGYEVKFAEATAWTSDKAAEGAFYATVAEVRDNRVPAIRADRLQRLVAATGALEKTLELTATVGTVVARLVNVSRPRTAPLSLAALGAVVERERQRPQTAEAYTPVVVAATMTRTRDLDLADLDAYIEFAGTKEGRWYHDTIAAAVVAGVEGASMDLEGILENNAHNASLSPGGGPDLDSLLVPLDSGRKVRLLAFAPAGTKAVPGIALRYETMLPLTDSAAIRREAGEVWDKLRGQFENDGARSVALQATGSVDGWVFPFASSRKFAWKREDSGEWTVVADAGSGLGELHTEVLWSVPP
ncbi:MAG: hypothetical protein ABR538_04985 [Candidatus Binatia bacterium]